MPVHWGRDSKGPYYQWGKTGKKYHYTPGNDRSKEIAKTKAQKQGKAIRASGYRE